MVEIRPATQELLRAFSGEDHRRTVRALVALEDGEVIGAAGLYVDPERLVCFAKLTERMRKHPRAIVRAAKRLLEMARGRAPVHAMADPQIEGSVKLLERLGFEKFPGTEVYVWRG